MNFDLFVFCRRALVQWIKFVRVVVPILCWSNTSRESKHSHLCMAQQCISSRKPLFHKLLVHCIFDEIQLAYRGILFNCYTCSHVKLKWDKNVEADFLIRICLLCQRMFICKFYYYFVDLILCSQQKLMTKMAGKFTF